MCDVSVTRPDENGEVEGGGLGDFVLGSLPPKRVLTVGTLGKGVSLESASSCHIDVILASFDR